MPEQLFTTFVQWIHPKDDESNIISATFHMITITLISMSLVDLTWFNIDGGVCVPYLTLGQFFWFGFSYDPTLDYSDYECITPKIVNMMRITILLCFMTIIFSLVGFFLEVIGPKHIVYRSMRKYSVFGICTGIWIVATISVSYYIVYLLEDSLGTVYSNIDTSVTYGIGFCLLATAGIITCCGILYSLILPFYTSSYVRDDDRCLLDAFDDPLDTFHSPTPPPPYCIPPPPYTP